MPNFCFASPLSTKSTDGRGIHLETATGNYGTVSLLQKLVIHATQGRLYLHFQSGHFPPRTHCSPALVFSPLHSSDESRHGHDKKGSGAGAHDDRHQRSPAALKVFPKHRHALFFLLNAALQRTPSSIQPPTSLVLHGKPQERHHRLPRPPPFPPFLPFLPPSSPRLPTHPTASGPGASTTLSSSSTSSWQTNKFLHITFRIRNHSYS
ncbi:hypothetical protein B296_00023233 [Ensete ventricosum]|uniref:Uncharacterized protein n=1 Tax=Ensete ventricosum TaxID=4639 RepID=A0A426ZDH4_ENSVE|nr:hypothetical protein B296_00023233 [Ensete ventricosum]